VCLHLIVNECTVYVCLHSNVNGCTVHVCLHSIVIECTVYVCLQFVCTVCAHESCREFERHACLFYPTNSRAVIYSERIYIRVVIQLLCVDGTMRCYLNDLLSTHSRRNKRSRSIRPSVTRPEINCCSSFETIII